MDWIKTILDKHAKEDGTVDLEAANREIDAEFPKNAVPKADFNSKVDELKTANETLDELKNNHKDVEALQKSIDDYESKVEQLEQEKADQAKSFALKSALTEAGAEDVDYFADKLSKDIELDEEGKLKGFEEKIKEYQTKHPKLFKTSENKQDEDDKSGFKLHDTGLDGGSTPPKLTKDEINKIQDPDERLEAIQNNMNLYN